MFKKLMTKVIGSRNERLLKRISGTVDKINALQPEFEQLSDDELKAKTAEFRRRHADGESLDALLPEAFAVVREAAWRTLEMRHYDVQLIGGVVLHQGKIAEMRTGEGKTLGATLPVYLNAIPAKGVHVITVNDYLAQRDAEWMRPVYEALGLSVGVALPGMDPTAKREAYGCDITYGTNNEFGFDYLRDNMAFRQDDRVQRELHYAIVDEVDSILIDEARTPLIISGPSDDAPGMYTKINEIVPKLERQDDPEAEEDTGDYTVDEKSKQVFLTERGMEHAEELLAKAGLIEEGEGLYDPQHLALVHHLNAALRAHALFQRDTDYIVRNGEVVIVDEFTGRTLAGRRWSDGLHQAVEAKEGVKIQRENQTLASITFQNYFRIYDKLAGMTGTADTEAYEFQTIYGLEVVVIPTHQPMVRDDRGDLVFLKPKQKYNAIIDDIRDCNERGQPVLVGTTSIETSEYISKLLKQAKIKHEVLNAKQHEREALIVAEAGRPSAVTIATNMAGRGTDIVLGGNLEVEIEQAGAQDDTNKRAQMKDEWRERHATVLEAGGLHIIGTERHESRRIDNQLRGRAGRQGDPGSSRFYLSLEDNLMRIFASDRVAGMMQRFGMEEDEAIEHPWVSKSIENAQRKVEAHNFDIRKNLLEYDDVANDQRKVIYDQRQALMEEEDVVDAVKQIRHDVMNATISDYVPPGSIDEQWDVAGLNQALDGEFGLDLDLVEWLEADDSRAEDDIREYVIAAADRLAREKEALTGPSVMRNFERAVMLNVLDSLWKDHLANMDYLRRGIGLRGYAQKQPKQEYKREAFQMFQDLLERIKHEVTKVLARVKVQAEEDVTAIDANRKETPMEFNHPDAQAAGQVAPPPSGQANPAGGAAAAAAAAAAVPETFVRDGEKVGRNQPCPCGSGKKYKHCHGKLS